MHKYFKDLTTLLIQKSLPPGYIRKAVSELRDHAHELADTYLDEGHTREKAEALATERIGDNNLIAERLITENRNSHFAGRHPIFNFIILPFIFMTLIPPMIIVPSVFISLGGIFSDGPSEAILIIFSAIEFFCIYGLIVLISIRVCILVLHSFRGMHWMFISLSVLALYGYYFYYTTSTLVPPTESDEGSYGIYSIGLAKIFTPDDPMIAEFSPNVYMGLLPLIIFMIFALWYRLQSRKIMESI